LNIPGAEIQIRQDIRQTIRQTELPPHRLEYAIRKKDPTRIRVRSWLLFFCYWFKVLELRIGRRLGDFIGLIVVGFRIGVLIE